MISYLQVHGRHESEDNKLKPGKEQTPRTYDELVADLAASEAIRLALTSALQLIRQHYTNDPNSLAGIIAMAALDPSNLVTEEHLG